MDKVVKATCALHNRLLKTSSGSYVPPGAIDAEHYNGQLILASWRSEGASTCVTNE